MHVEENSFVFFVSVTRAVPSWFVVQCPFFFVSVIIRTVGVWHIVFALSALFQVQGWCQGLHLHFMAAVVRRGIPSSWQKRWTTRDYHRQHYHFT